MPYEIQWLVPNKVVYQKLIGHLDTDEASEAMDSVLDYLDASDEPLVHVVTDMTENEHLPMSISQSRKTVSNMLSHSRMGWAIIYGKEDYLLKFVASVTAQFFQTRIRIFDTLDGAEDFLEYIMPEVEKLSILIENRKNISN